MNRRVVQGLIASAETLGVGVAMLRGFVDASWRGTLLERLGYGNWTYVTQDNGGVDRIWIHAASVGELNGLISVVDGIEDDFPEVATFISTTSVTGKHEVVSRKLSEISCLLPFDHPWIVSRVISRLRPKIFVVTETELWPSLLFALHQQRIPILLVNGRLSDFSFPMYYRLRAFTKPVMETFSRLLVQTELDAERFVALGAPVEAVEVAGSTKYDQDTPHYSARELDSLANGLGLNREFPCFVAGSVRPQEDASVIAAYLSAREVVKNLQMIIAPRHPERFEEVAGLLARYKIDFHRRSDGLATKKVPVVLLDNMGELRRIYSLATFSFVGGTLVNYGGHNPLEPASYKSPVILGPHSSNYRDAVQQLRRAGGMLQVESSDELSGLLIKLSENELFRRSNGEIAYRIWRGNLGATSRVRKWLRYFVLDYEAARKDLQVGMSGGNPMMVN